MVNSDVVIEELVDSGCYKELNKNFDDNSVVLEVVNHIKDIKKDKTLIVGLVGGAASGKSTMTDSIPMILESSAVICTDDYVIGDRKFRRPIDKKNSVDKYDSDLLNKKVRDICSLESEEKVSVPTYEQISGLAIAKGEENFNREVGKVDYLIVEGDFDLVDKPEYKIYFHVSDDIRLRNRIDRDTIKRNQTDVK